MRLPVFAALSALVLSLASPARATEEFVLYKDPNCGCCGDYAKVLESEGYKVRVKETTALDALRRMAGVPDKLASCHTITVGKYLVEGHVPVAAVRSRHSARERNEASRSRKLLMSSTRRIVCIEPVRPRAGEFTLRLTR